MREQKVIQKFNIYKKINFLPFSTGRSESPHRSIDPFFPFFLIAFCFCFATDWQKNDCVEVLVQ